MKGLWLENQTLELRDDLPVPTPPKGEALVRVLQAGICNTDLELIRGYYPYTGILGHEFVGIVEAAAVEAATDAASKLQPGQRVVGEINAACGQCHYCQSGLARHCERRSVLGIMQRSGAFANYLTLPAENLHLVPETVSNDAATFTEPLAAALEILEQVAIGPNDRVVVIGDGKLGQLVAQTLALTGCDLLAVGRHEAKLANLSARGIATGFTDAIAPRSCDVAVDCTGNPAGFELARQALRPRGTLVLKSTYAGNLSLDASALVVDEITLVGSRCGPFDKALALLTEHAVDVEPLIATRYSLDRGLEAFARAQQRGTMKVLVEMDAGH
ncbi:MAG: alcohol dehydrogenase catalytic domain-containing protein [Cyanobacteria bacterium J06641_5]